MKQTPYTPFSTRFSGNTKEVQMRFRSILKWKKTHPPMVALALILCVSVLCCSMVGCQTDSSPDPSEAQAALPSQHTAQSDAANCAVELSDQDAGNVGQGVGSFTGCLGSDDLQENLTYTGDILTVPFTYKGSGVGVGDGKGFGVMLMLNGVPQPYYTDEEPEWSYFHNVCTDLSVGKVNLHMIPVTGTEGDCMKLTLLKVNDPEYRISIDGRRPFKLVEMAYMISRDMDFQAKPPVCPKPDVPQRVLDIKKNVRDTTDFEIFIQQEQGRNYNMTPIVGGTPVYITPYVSEEDQVVIHIDVWDNPEAIQSLVLFVNNEPLIVDPEQAIHFSTEPGKTTEFDITIDHSDMEDETVIYGVRIIENYAQCGENIMDPPQDAIGSIHFLNEQWRGVEIPFYGPGEE